MLASTSCHITTRGHCTLVTLLSDCFFTHYLLFYCTSLPIAFYYCSELQHYDFNNLITHCVYFFIWPTLFYYVFTCCKLFWLWLIVGYTLLYILETILSCLVFTYKHKDASWGWHVGAETCRSCINNKYLTKPSAQCWFFYAQPSNARYKQQIVVYIYMDEIFLLGILLPGPWISLI
jgi:hypothetical protein